MISITSGQNPAIKEIKLLKQRKAREEKGLFFIEGTRFIEEAVKENAAMRRIVVSQGMLESGRAGEILNALGMTGCEICIVPDPLYGEISDTETPQGIMAVLPVTRVSLEKVLEDKAKPFLVLLDAIQDPGNLGTIIRTADAAGADGVILSKGCVDVYNPKVLRSTMGSIFHIPVCTVQSIADTIGMLGKRGVKVYASHLSGDRMYFDMDTGNGVAIVIGNEANGISDEAALSAHGLVKIPMPGKSESLNASVAAGLLMYEVVRQRTLFKEV